MMEQERFEKLRAAQRRAQALAVQIAELEAEIAAEASTVPDLGQARVSLTPVTPGQNTKWLTTNLAEVVARDVSMVQLLRMDAKSAWLGLSMGDKGRVGIQLAARLKPIRLDIMPTEAADVRYT